MSNVSKIIEEMWEEFRAGSGKAYREGLEEERRRQRKRPSNTNRSIAAAFIAEAGDCRCPVWVACAGAKITTPEGVPLENFELDHGMNRSNAELGALVPMCRDCNRALGEPGFTEIRRKHLSAFEAYWDRLCKWRAAQNKQGRLWGGDEAA